MRKIIDILIIIINPMWWMMNSSYDEVWDKKLNELMKNYKFINEDEYHTTIGGHRIWIQNHPYASFTSPNLRNRPKRLTIMRAKRKMKIDNMSVQEKRNALLKKIL